MILEALRLTRREKDISHEITTIRPGFGFAGHPGTDGDEIPPGGGTRPTKRRGPIKIYEEPILLNYSRFAAPWG